MDYKQFFYPESKFGGFSDIDATVIFFFRVNSLIDARSIVLDIGCGRGVHASDNVSIRRELKIFKKKCKKVIGIDVDPEASKNPFIDDFHLIEGDEFPLEDDSIDMALCNSVLEHIETPEIFFSECSRVIKPLGYLCINTGNLWGYPGLIANLIPNKLHDAVLKKVQPNRKEIDIFPTLYKCNTIWKIKKMLNKYNFEHCVYGYGSEPSYLNFNLVFYYLGVIHQRFSPKIFKPAIHAFARKKK